MISFYVIPPKNDNEESFSQRRKDLYLFNTVFSVCRCFHLLLDIFTCYVFLFTNGIK
mgnify:CR=1 FL=1